MADPPHDIAERFDRLHARWPEVIDNPPLLPTGTIDAMAVLERWGAIMDEELGPDRDL